MHGSKFQLKDASRKPQSMKLPGTLEVSLGAPFAILLTASDSDLDTPSPLSLYFDLSKPPSSPLRATSEWSDSDSDSEAEFALETADDSQYITILSDSPFYVPHSPPSFQKSFDIPAVPSPSSSSSSLSASHKDSVAQFRADLEHIFPSEMKKSLFLVDEECLKSIDEELFSAPLDAFVDVCLARLRPNTLLPTRDSAVEFSTPSPKYHLASFLDLDGDDASSLHPSLRELFTKHTPSTSTGWPAYPRTGREALSFL
ncbi:hypothetical protein R3P38DRAFT_3546467 [Favolaschia claudopus]|uniref:Uncharacterized protein n=1 Tax=Favolaschia claudopus TaxID=2862362 RepID=A0AAW0E0S6_9AGAR